MSVERCLHDAALDSSTAAVNQPDFRQAGGGCGSGQAEGQECAAGGLGGTGCQGIAACGMHVQRLHHPLGALEPGATVTCHVAPRSVRVVRNDPQKFGGMLRVRLLADRSR